MNGLADSEKGKQVFARGYCSYHSLAPPRQRWPIKIGPVRAALRAVTTGQQRTETVLSQMLDCENFYCLISQFWYLPRDVCHTFGDAFGTNMVINDDCTRRHAMHFTIGCGRNGGPGNGEKVEERPVNWDAPRTKFGWEEIKNSWLLNVFMNCCKKKMFVTGRSTRTHCNISVTYPSSQNKKFKTVR